MWSKQLSRYSDWGPVVLRLVLGIIFIAHGWGKLFGMAPGMEAWVGMVTGLGFPAATATAYLVALVEFVGGVAVLLGLFTRYAAALIAIVMAVAIWKVKFAMGLLGGYELDLGLLGIALALVLLGPGKLSLEKMLWKKEM